MDNQFFPKLSSFDPSEDMDVRPWMTHAAQTQPVYLPRCPRGWLQPRTLQLLPVGSSRSAAVVDIPFSPLCPQLPTRPRCWERIIQSTANDGSSGQSGQGLILISHLRAAMHRLIWEALRSPGCVTPSLCSAVLVASLLGKTVQCPLAVLCRGGHIFPRLEYIHH